jgi:hypothetical protein
LNDKWLMSSCCDQVVDSAVMTCPFWKFVVSGIGRAVVG